VAGPFRPRDVRALVQSILERSGASAADAAIVSDHVVDAEMRENRSQGLVRIPAYSKWARQGLIVSQAEPSIERDGDSTLVVSGRQGWGHVVTRRTMELCVERARRNGVCLALLKDTGHIGRLGYYVEIAAAHGMIGLIAGSGNPKSAWVAPWGGTQPVFGTNPIAFGFPRPGQEPVVVDISTTQTARGNVLLHQQTNTALPDGWAFDRDGKPTNDPHQALPPGGTLAPLGGHKGYAIAIAVEILCGVLGGPWPPASGSYLLLVIDIDAVSSPGVYAGGLERLIALIKSGVSRQDVDEIMIPGEGSARRRRQNADSISVAPELWSEVTTLARELGAESPLL
jgi:LDH2 family malate/lactate/ureidoglycolate dehydrogenase